MPGGREKVTGQMPEGQEFCFQPCHRSIEFIVSDVVNCFNIWYSEVTQRISDTYNTFYTLRNIKEYNFVNNVFQRRLKGITIGTEL